jgi:hypothetical protein
MMIAASATHHKNQKSNQIKRANSSKGKRSIKFITSTSTSTLMRSEKKSHRDRGRYFLFFSNDRPKKYKVQLIEKKVNFIIYLNINRVFRIRS